MLINVVLILKIINLLVVLRRIRQVHRRKRLHRMLLMMNLQPIFNLISAVIQLRQLQRNNPMIIYTAPRTKAHKLLSLLFGYRRTMTNRDVWTNLSQNWRDFFWLSGDFPESLELIVHEIQRRFPRRFGRTPRVSFRNKVLLTIIWLRRYPTMNHLAMHFGITEGCVCKIIHTMLPRLHVYLVPKYIKWHSMNKWRSLAGNFPEWPQVVAILDCTCFRITRPAGQLESFYYRGDKKFNFINWLVICDNELNIVYSRPGFLGHLHDSTCYNHIQLPVLPQGLQIMADRGFPNVSPLLVPLPPRGGQLPPNLRRSFRRLRSSIERCFGNIKNAFACCGSIRYRSRRYSASLVCNVVAALYNRRKMMFDMIRNEIE